MRAREFTINVPITIKINGDNEPEIDVPTDDDSEESPVFVSPLQQELELKKAEVGKESEVIDDLTDDDEEKFNESKNELSRILQLTKDRNNG